MFQCVIYDLSGKHSQTAWYRELYRVGLRQFENVIPAGTFPLFLLESRHLTENRGFFNSLDNRKIDFGIIHISDENYSGDLGAYFLDRCRVIFRSYYRPPGGIKDFLRLYSRSLREREIHRHHPKAPLDLLWRAFYRFRDLGPRFLFSQCFPRLPREKTIFTPIGYLDRVAGRIGSPESGRPVSERKYVWSFCGDSSKRDRGLMIKLFLDRFPGHLHQYSGWMPPGRVLSGEDYWNTLADSKFVPCPMGWVNLETMRLYEALEAGAIPLLLESHAGQPYDYFSGLFGPHPLPLFRDWTESVRFVEDTQSRGLEDLSLRIREWYRRFKSGSKDNIQVRLRRCREQYSTVSSHEISL